MRITPAHAGKRAPCTAPGQCPRDHPRTRGEKLTGVGLWCKLIGSPPHTRGKERAAANTTANPGITPAHAGKRFVSNIPRIFAQDHPRTRGEKYFCTSSLIILIGSPPHTRGKAASPRRPAWPAGITPAHAGKSNDYTELGNHAEDHPRTRGEKAGRKWVLAAVGGSPPHTRGKAVYVRACLLSLRITPAHAGKSLEVSSIWCGIKKVDSLFSRIS